jgi:transposase
MARKRKNGAKAPPQPHVIHQDAAGIDIGATEIFVAVPADRDETPVRCFPTFTQDLNALADWLQRCGIKTVAMESTGVYWIPLFQILETRGVEVCLVNAHHAKNAPGRRTDVSDCQWLQYLHSVGLLRASFRPAQEICSVRTLLRHREGLVQMASGHIQHMQKSLDQMNLQIHHVLSDITGVTGLAIIDAILAGERDPQVLAKLRDWRVRANGETVAKSLVGDYRREHLFTLRQSLAAYRQCQQLIAECRGGEPDYDLRTQHYRILGVDLTQVPGMSSQSKPRELSAVPSPLAPHCPLEDAFPRAILLPLTYGTQH